MNLLIDIGNSRSKYVFADNSEMSAVESINSDEISKEWLFSNAAQVKACYLANVNQFELAQQIENWCQQLSIPCTLIKTLQEKFGVRCSYANPAGYGVDRWLTLLGANKLFPGKACLIIDAGTATTVDLLAGSGEHLGGWILPGIEMQITSLTSNTEQVSAKMSAVKQLSFANNTSDAVNQAAWASTLGLVEIAMQQALTYEQVSKESLEIIFTGGNGERLSQLFTGQCHWQEKLVFIGMQRYS